MSMVEEVARAIDPMSAKIADMLVAKGLSRDETLVILPMEKARAAIEAMRNEADAVAEAIAAEANCCGGIADTIWTKAIDAALNEEG